MLSRLPADLRRPSAEDGTAADARLDGVIAAARDLLAGRILAEDDA
jgi:hypothetical protein